MGVFSGGTPASLPPSGTASGDLSGTYPGPTVAKVNGVGVTGTPSVGFVPTATSASAATWQAGGGSQAVKSVSVPIAFDTAEIILQPGILIYTPSVGEILIAAVVSVTEAWDSSVGQASGTLQFAGQGTGSQEGLACGADLETVNPDYPSTGAGTGLTQFADTAVAAATFGVAMGRFAATTPLRFFVDNGSGVDPGSTQGAGDIHLLIWTP